MSGSNETGARDLGRREFLLASAGAAAISASALEPTLGQTTSTSSLPTVTLGKTGEKATVLGMGTSWSLQPSFVQAALKAGVRYIDTSENYENTLAEKVLGDVLERTGMRKDVYLVTKNGRGKVGGAGAHAAYEKRLTGSLDRLKTDYIDCYYLHGIEGREIGLLKDPDVKAAFEKLKKSGKIKFCGFSCHDRRLPEIVTAAAECGWIDQIMIQYNYRTMLGDDIRRALDAARKANLGLVAMKTQGGAGGFREVKPSGKFQEFVDKGFKKEQAAIKTVLAEGLMQVVVSEMTNRDMLRENMAACMAPKLSLREQEQLEQHRQATAHLYCHGCGQHCEPAAGGVQVAEILRYLRYDEVYGKTSRARELYRALPESARVTDALNLSAAEAACPHGLPVAALIDRASLRLG